MKTFLALLLSLCCAHGAVEITGVGLVTQPKWDDILSPGLAVKLGNTAPSFSAFGPSGNLLIYAFAASGSEQIYTTTQFPHSWSEGTEVRYHIHYTPTQAPTGTNVHVVFAMEYSMSTIGAAFTAPSTLKMTNEISSTPWMHQISAFPSIVQPTAKLSTIMVIRIYRDGDSASDSYAYPISFLGADPHIIKDSMGSTGEVLK